MNEQVETIYTQMFAPEPIPQSVREMYDRAKFLADRVDSPNISVGGLILIAVTATKSAKKPVGRPRKISEVDTDEVGETLPVQTYTDTQAADAQKPAEPQTATGSMDAPLGKMDVPAPPETALQRGMSVRRLNLLTRPELRAHAKEFYPNLDVKKSWTKSKLVNAIHATSPSKPGAQAKHAKEVKKNGRINA